MAAGGGRSSLEAMLGARSVAVVGASARPGSFGEQLILELERGPFDGEVFPVNPRYSEVMGRDCFPDLASIDPPVDTVLLGVSNALLEEQLEAAAATGAASAVIFASCYEQIREGRPPLTERLAAIARAAGMAVCGGNCMGFLNLDERLRCCGFPMPEIMRPGPVTFISHSGSAFAAFAHNDRDLSFNLVVSSGNELVTTAAGYLDYALDLETTRVVGMFLETVREPESFRTALEKAGECDVPVVVLKVGRSERARYLVEAHSGALAGADAAYEALFESCGVIRVETLDEMADTLELMASGRRAGPGKLAAIGDSGGERAMLIDVAAANDVEWAELSDATRTRLEAVLEEGLPAANPLDAWGTGNDAERIFVECMHALLDDEEVAALAFCVDLTTEAQGAASYVHPALRVFADSAKPVAMLSNLRSAIDPDDARALRAAGMAVLEGTSTGLQAFRHLLEYRDFRCRPPLSPAQIGEEVRSKWRARLSTGDAVGEAEALALLADYDIAAVETAEAKGPAEALRAAERIGWPVALKTVGSAHKSDALGVAVNLSGAGPLRAAYDDISSRLGPRVVVEAMAPPGVELALGVLHDDQFGPLVMVGAGGVLVELLSDRRFSLPPLDRGRARRLVDGLRMRALLDGGRGRPPSDVDAVADALVQLSAIAVDLGDLIEALDVNPLIAGPGGAVAADALLATRPQ